MTLLSSRHQCVIPLRYSRCDTRKGEKGGGRGGGGKKFQQGREGDNSHPILINVGRFPAAVPVTSCGEGGKKGGRGERKTKGGRTSDFFAESLTWMRKRGVAEKGRRKQKSSTGATYVTNRCAMAAVLAKRKGRRT